MSIAIISACGQYRYRLERRVPPHPHPLAHIKPLPLAGKVVAFFGINPSTADAHLDDATVRKWTGFCQRWGAAKFIVGNVCAFRATDVREMAEHRMAIGPLHDSIEHLDSIIEDADILVPCWGNRSKARHLDFDLLLRMLWNSGKPVMHFGLTKSGDPKHPLMLGYDTPLLPYVREVRAVRRPRIDL